MEVAMATDPARVKQASAWLKGEIYLMELGSDGRRRLVVIDDSGQSITSGRDD
jgi:hypothetical protein